MKREIISGGHRDYFLEFISRNPETETARDYRSATKADDCIPIEDFPDIPGDIFLNYVAPVDYERYLQGCDLREEEDEERRGENALL